MLGWLFYLNVEMMHFFILQIFMLPVIVFFAVWFAKVVKDKKEANFNNTMRMNMLASVCTNLGFITLLILKAIE
jgi:1,4-dihydroxy-2-naphthoate octaprenyltransferase